MMDNHNESQTYDENDFAKFINDIIREQENVTDNHAERILSLCKNLLNKILLSKSATDSSKRKALFSIDSSLNQIKPYTLIGTKNTDRTTLLSIIEYMISIIETYGPPQIDDISISQDIISLPPHEMYIRVYCRNIILCLQEFMEVLKRADGNQTTDHPVNGDSPFLNNEYFSFVSFPATMSIKRHFYPFDRVNSFSGNSIIKLKNIIDEEINGAMPNSLLLEKYIKKANVCLESHKNELNCEDNPIKMSLDEKFMTIIMYLLRFPELIDVENFDKTQELNKKVLNNLEDFYYMLITLPLTQVLKPIDSQKMITYFKDIIYAGTIAKTRNANYPSPLEKILMKVNTAAYQLWHMCLKQETPYSYTAASVIILEHRIEKVSQAPFITANSWNDWKLKFALLANEEEVLSKCPFDTCCICLEPFVDEYANSVPRDLAVLPKCIHLVCVECLKQIIAESGVK